MVQQSVLQRFGCISEQRTPFLTIIGFGMLFATGCSELTSVDTLDVVQIEDLENRMGARALRAGALIGFTEMFASGFLPEMQPGASGLLVDEFMSAGTPLGIDQRRIGFNTGLFTNWSGARVRLVRAVSAMQRFDASAAEDIAELLALTAYIELFFAENFCSGVPLASFHNGQLVHGEPLATVQLLERAIASFESALGSIEGQTTARHLASVGRARALLSLERYADAATAISGVPTNFSYQTEHAPQIQGNGIWRWMTVSRQWTVADREGDNGLDFVTALDPRVATQRLQLPGSDGQTPVYVATKFGSETSPVVLASGVEARLIEAEALLRAGDAVSALEKLNVLRQTISGLGPLSLESTEEARVDQLFRERAFWLFGTGHRHGDLRRLVRHYGRDPQQIFPTGVYRNSGVTYGTDLTLVLPERDGNNPHFAGCLSTDP